MNLKCKKGMTIIESILALSVMAMISVISVSIFIFCSNSFRDYAAFTRQQASVQTALQRLGKDVEEAAGIKVKYAAAPVLDELVVMKTDGSIRKWKLQNDKLMCCDIAGGADNTAIAAANADKAVVEGIFTSGSELSYNGTNEYIVIAVRPVPASNLRHGQTGIPKPIVMEYSVQYKKVESY